MYTNVHSYSAFCTLSWIQTCSVIRQAPSCASLRLRCWAGEGLAGLARRCPPPPPSRSPGAEVAPGCLGHLPPAVRGRCEGLPGSNGARPWAWPPGAPPDAAAAPLRPFRLPRRRRRRFRAGDGEAAGAAAAAGGREGAREPPPSRGRALRHRHLALVGEPGPGGETGASLCCAHVPVPAFPFPAAAARGVRAPGGGEEVPAVLCALRGERGRVRRGRGTAGCGVGARRGVQGWREAPGEARWGCDAGARLGEEAPCGLAASRNLAVPCSGGPVAAALLCFLPRNTRVKARLGPGAAVVQVL